MQSLGQLDEAIVAYSKSVAIDKQFALAYANRGCCRLLPGDYAPGWADYQWRLRTGQVDINGGRFNPLAPFGGYKKSGIGREIGPLALEEFFQLKSIQR